MNVIGPVAVPVQVQNGEKLDRTGPLNTRYDQETAIIILGVMKRMENAADSLTGEQLELSADHLCVAVETKEDKKRNESVMTALREQARKIRAK